MEHRIPFLLSEMAAFLLQLIFVMSGNIFDVAVKDVAEYIDGVHVDAFIVLQTVKERLAEMIFSVQGIFCDAFFFHSCPKLIIFYQTPSPLSPCISFIIGLG